MHRQHRAVKIVIAAIIAVVGATLRAQQPEPSDIVRIQVDPGSVLAPIAEDFIGFGYETSAVAHARFFSAKKRTWCSSTAR